MPIPKLTPSWGAVVRAGLLATALLLGGQVRVFGAIPPPFSGSITASFSQSSDSQKSDASLGLESDLFFQFSKKLNAELLATLQRPTDSYRNFRFPRLLLSLRAIAYAEETGTLAALYSISGLDIDEWSAHGAVVQHLVGAEAQWMPINRLSLQLRAGPTFYTNQYRTRANGIVLPTWGFYQRVDATFQPGRWLFNLRLTAEERQAGVWKNDYSTLERIGYWITRNWNVSLLHRFTGQIVDDSTGLYRPVQFFDSRESRFAVLTELDF